MRGPLADSRPRARGSAPLAASSRAEGLAPVEIADHAAALVEVEHERARYGSMPGGGTARAERTLAALHREVLDLRHAPRARLRQRDAPCVAARASRRRQLDAGRRTRAAPFATSAEARRGGGRGSPAPAPRAAPPGARAAAAAAPRAKRSKRRTARLRPSDPRRAAGASEEGRDALAEVARAGGQHLVAVLHRDRLLEAAGVDVQLEALLGEAQRQRRVAQHALRELARGGVELARRAPRARPARCARRARRR